MEKERKYRFKLMFQEIDLPATGLMIGRSPEATLTLDDPLVSRFHARVAIEEDGVYVEDLGSRNGTLVNGKPTEGRIKLAHQDRVRIGAHELVFVQEGMTLDYRDRPTFVLTTCSACGTPFPERAVACPHCGVRSGHMVSCGTCGATAMADSAFCAQCGSSLDGNTGPLQTAGAVSDWTERLVEEVIDRAIDAGRFEQAGKMLDDRAALLDDAEPGPSLVRTLEWYSERAARLAKAQKNSQRLESVVARWRISGAIMTVELLTTLLEAANGWFSLRPALHSYWATVIAPAISDDERAAALDQSLCRVLRPTEESR